MNDIKQTIPSCFRSECNSIINETIDNMKSEKFSDIERNQKENI